MKPRFIDYITKAAKSVTDANKCNVHQERAKFKAVNNLNGANLQWETCCEGFKKIIERKLKPVMERTIKQFGEESFKYALKNIK